MLSKIVGIWEVSIKMIDWIMRNLRNVRYIPNIERNLISIRVVLNEVGYTCKKNKIE